LLDQFRDVHFPFEHFTIVFAVKAARSLTVATVLVSWIPKLPTLVSDSQIIQLVLEMANHRVFDD
jgi:hypothetical protein